MPKFVDSMLKVFKREKKGHRGLDKARSRSNRPVLDADSFIFMPGDSESQYWGKILNDENFTSVEDSRRKTHIGFVQSGESNGLQEVNLIISPSVQEKKDEDFILNGKVFNRRLSGTLVKARKSTDEVEDGPVIRDYAFLLTARERLSQELSDRYVYDRLIRPPMKPKPSNPPAPAAHQWQYPREGKKPPLLSDRRWNDKDEVVLRRTVPSKTSTPSKNDKLLRVDHSHFTCTVRDTQNKREADFLRVGQRPLSGQTFDSQGYSNLELSHSIMGSEYAMPADAINWELNIEGEVLGLILDT